MIAPLLTLLKDVRRLWSVAAIMAISVAALVSGVPHWVQAVLVLAQGAAIWHLTGPDGTRPVSRAGAIRVSRADLVARLAPDAAPPGTQGAALVLRIDDLARLRSLHGARRVDALAEVLSARLSEGLRTQDAYCALDPDGFGVVLHPQRGMTLGMVLAVCQRLQDTLARPVTLDDVTLWPSLSIGFATNTRAALLNGLTLLQAAEVAAEKALRGGPGGLNSYSVVDFPATLTGLRISELTQALETGEIRAYFQPQIRTDTGHVSGMEALARWHHPVHGLIPPGEFLPQVQAAGLSQKLTERMLRDSLVALNALDAAALPVPCVAINLSTEDLANPLLADTISWELDRHDLPPERLAVEILETVVANRDDDVAVRTIARLAGMGCTVDLDDFGTGHASIANLRRFAVGRVKIDRSFVTRMHQDTNQQRMVAAILSMAGQLGIDTLAEGVESAEEQVLLAQLGCGHLQGFAIARPMPAADLPGWLRAHAAALAQGEPRCEDPAQARAAPGAFGG